MMVRILCFIKNVFCADANGYLHHVISYCHTAMRDWISLLSKTIIRSGYWRILWSIVKSKFSVEYINTCSSSVPRASAAEPLDSTIVRSSHQVKHITALPYPCTSHLIHSVAMFISFMQGIINSLTEGGFGAKPDCKLTPLSKLRGSMDVPKVWSWVVWCKDLDQ